MCGAASAPIVASAFSPALAPVGVLLAVLACSRNYWRNSVHGMDARNFTLKVESLT